LDDGTETLREPDSPYEEIGVCRPQYPPRRASPAVVVLKGRLLSLDIIGGGYMHPLVDATASRLHTASVAGLVVGAMGCLVFGLYLRRWLIDRKALVSQLGQDMIA
jgi:hypothetical protein